MLCISSHINSHLFDAVLVKDVLKRLKENEKTTRKTLVINRGETRVYSSEIIHGLLFIKSSDHNTILVFLSQ